MSSASLLEQLTSSVSPTMLAIVSVVILGLLLIYTIACRIFFSSSKSKTSSAKQSSNKDKKPKESNATKKIQSTVTTTNKKKNNKQKANTHPMSSNSSPTTQSDDTENEKTGLISGSNKSLPSIKESTVKKSSVPNETNKSNNSTNTMKTLPTKQQGTAVAEKFEGQNNDNKNKQSKPNASMVSNKEKTLEKRDGTNKSNSNNTKKNESVSGNTENKRTLLITAETGSDPEDEGQWLTQGSKQLNNRNRNKGKTETTNINNPLPSNHNILSEQRSTLTNSQSNISSSLTNHEVNIEAPASWNNSTIPNESVEPIEIYQLLPKNENLYTSNDNWWKHALNKKQTFSIDDIGEWPEYEQDQQYIVQVKKIIPTKKSNEKKIVEEL